MKKLAIILGAILVVLCLMGSASAFDLNDIGSAIGLGDNSGSNDDSKFIVGFDAEFPPYGFKNDTTGEYVGFDLDLAQEVCDRNNWTLVKQPINWDAKDTELDSGSIDCIWNGFTINGREDDYDSNINSLEDLAGKKVEVQADSSALAALEEDQKSLADTFEVLTQVADYNTAFMDLESGACDAVAMDIGVAQYKVSSASNPDDYKILDKEISSEQYGVGFKKGNTELKDQVQKTLDEMKEDGTIDEIAAKYESYGVPGSLI